MYDYEYKCQSHANIGMRHHHMQILEGDLLCDIMNTENYV